MEPLGTARARLEKIGRRMNKISAIRIIDMRARIASVIKIGFDPAAYHARTGLLTPRRIFPVPARKPAIFYA